MQNKRGISAVVATVLIILITVAAVTIIWTAVIPLISDQLAQGTACLDATKGLSLANDGYTCIGANEVTVQVKHGSTDIDLRDIQFSFLSGGSSSIVNLRSIANAQLPGINGEKVYTIPFDKIKESSGKADLTIDKLDKVSIAAVVGNGKTETTCEKTAEVTLVKCQ